MQDWENAIQDVDLPRLLFRLGPLRPELNAPLWTRLVTQLCEASPKLRDSSSLGLVVTEPSRGCAHPRMVRYYSSVTYDVGDVWYDNDEASREELLIVQKQEQGHMFAPRCYPCYYHVVVVNV